MELERDLGSNWTGRRKTSIGNEPCTLACPPSLRCPPPKAPPPEKVQGSWRCSSRGPTPAPRLGHCWPRGALDTEVLMGTSQSGVGWRKRMGSDDGTFSILCIVTKVHLGPASVRCQPADHCPPHLQARLSMCECLHPHLEFPESPPFQGLQEGSMPQRAL